MQSPDLYSFVSAIRFALSEWALESELVSESASEWASVLRRKDQRVPLATSRCSSDNFYYRLSLCGEQLLDLFGELDDEAPPDRRLAPFSPGSIGP